MQEAQRARFEHGEGGRPQPYVVDTPTAIEPVYVAGAVLAGEDRALPWRADIFGAHEFNGERYSIRPF